MFSSCFAGKIIKEMEKRLRRVSKFLSLVLRHKPDEIGLSLDAEGWIKVDTLLHAMQKAGVRIDRELLRQVVAQNNKQRFSFSDDGLMIRANQGHSLPVELGLDPLVPPEILFHGTATRFLDSICKQGLLPKGRQQVHLSPDEQTAIKVGQRHGKVAVLQVLAGEMHKKGFLFYCSKNGVWLTETVPPEFLNFPSKENGDRSRNDSIC